MLFGVCLSLCLLNISQSKNALKQIKVLYFWKWQLNLRSWKAWKGHGKSHGKSWNLKSSKEYEPWYCLENYPKCPKEKKERRSILNLRFDVFGYVIHESNYCFGCTRQNMLCLIPFNLWSKNSRLVNPETSLLVRILPSKSECE